MGQRGRRQTDREPSVIDRRDLLRPRRYRVVLHNDDYTTMEFVIQILLDLFHKTRTEAMHLMLHVHAKGRGVCGEYPHDVAETKVALVTDRAKESGFPLLCTMEPVD